MALVKICGLASAEDALVALAEGADALGFIFEPTSPRRLRWSPEEFTAFLASLGPYRPPTVAVYGVAGPSNGADFVQWVKGRVPVERHILSIRPEPGLDWEEVKERVTQSKPEALQVDGFSAGQYGGTGHRPDEEFIVRVKEQFDLPLVLAGGLNPANVAEAVRRHHPYAVDVSSGVEAAVGKKDIGLVRAFIQAAKSA